ncbi:MAG TPA: hypothetical protein VNA04_05065 [Thermoanaerobaculia bacterium]|nr:hypothetical protein [Thermoanaerobaculia bacterium]
MNRSRGPLISAVLAVAAIRLLTLPYGFWNAGEVRFAQALQTFDPLRQQPDAPGYPLYVALGRLIHFFVRDPFAALVVLSVAASILSAWLIGRLAGSLLGSAWSGAAVAILVLLSPAMIVFGPLPNAESVALACVAAALLFLVEKKPEPFALAAAAAIGVRPQLAPAMLVVFAAGCAVLPRKLRAGTLFSGALLLVFVPMAEAIGAGLLWEWLGPHLRPHAAADFLGAGGRETLLRFTAHPWGGKALSLPLLAAATGGMLVALRRYRSVAALAIGGMGAVHLLVCLLTASPSDGVQPILPALLPAGFFAVAALARWPIAAAGFSALFATVSLVYGWPLIEERTRRAAPAVMAMRYAARTLPAGAVLVADPDLAPFAAGHPAVITPEKFDEVARRHEVDLYLLMHGRSHAAGARVFEWSDSDAYGKLTTEKFRVVSLVPQPPAQRYVGGSGVYVHESSPERGEWRWLTRNAVIEVVAAAPSLALRFRLPHDAPMEANRLLVGGTAIDVLRGSSVEVVVPFVPQLVVRAERSYLPRDGRDLAIQLVALEQR